MVLLVVQQRMGSTRLPGKAMRMIAGKTLTERVLTRAAMAMHADRVVLAVPFKDSAEFSPLVQATNRGGPLLSLFKGSEKDVLARFYYAARGYGTTICRVTGDCPLIDPTVIDGCIRQFNQSDCDYLSTSHPERQIPSGFDVEVFSYDALARAHFECLSDGHREHVTQHFYERNCGSSRFQIATWRPEVKWLGAMPHLSVDTESDIAEVERAIRICGEGAGWREYSEAVHVVI